MRFCIRCSHNTPLWHIVKGFVHLFYRIAIKHLRAILLVLVGNCLEFRSALGWCILLVHVRLPATQPILARFF